MTQRIRAAWLALPGPVRLFARDAVEGGIAAVLVLNLVIPGSLVEAEALALTVGTALAPPIIAAARRYIVPAVLGWFSSTFAEPEPPA